MASLGRPSAVRPLNSLPTDQGALQSFSGRGWLVPRGPRGEKKNPVHQPRTTGGGCAGARSRQTGTEASAHPPRPSAWGKTPLGNLHRGACGRERPTAGCSPERLPQNAHRPPQCDRSHTLPGSRALRPPPPRRPVCHRSPAGSQSRSPGEGLAVPRLARACEHGPVSPPARIGAGQCGGNGGGLGDHLRLPVSPLDAAGGARPASAQTPGWQAPPA